jgi:peptidoglycan/xylan/chitin deacetylase (PgdA/CDA1 family)
MYHELSADDRRPAADRRPYVLSVGTFRRHLAAITAGELPARTVGEWAGLRGTTSKAGAPAAQLSSVMITFDDGDASNYTHALPMLREARVCATFFVTVGRIGDKGFMGWEEVKALHRAGMEIGSHTLTHRPPARLSDAELRYELTESKKRLEDRLGVPVRSISSPTGFANPRMSDLAQEAGYIALCGGRIAPVSERVLGVEAYLALRRRALRLRRGH